MIAELDARYSDAGTSAPAWDDTAGRLEAAPLYWLITLRADGRPHVTPLVGVFSGGNLYFTTGAGEQKHRNLIHDPRCTLLTGTNALHSGADVVVEGGAERVTDPADLQRIADAYLAKYGEEWHFEVEGGEFRHSGGAAEVFRVAPVTVYGFGKQPYTHTRYRAG